MGELHSSCSQDQAWDFTSIHSTLYYIYIMYIIPYIKCYYIKPKQYLKNEITVTLVTMKLHVDKMHKVNSHF